MEIKKLVDCAYRVMCSNLVKYGLFKPYFLKIEFHMASVLFKA